MKINGNAIKTGMIINHKNSNWRVVSVQSVKPGKGGAFAQVELKNINDNSKLNERFRSNETVDRLYVESLEYQFSYKENGIYHFMNTKNFEIIDISEAILGKSKQFIQDNMLVNIDFIDSQPVSVKLPENIKETVVQTEAVIKGQTVSSSFKPALLSNGFKIMVPGHIDNDTEVVISTSTFEYVEKAK